LISHSIVTHKTTANKGFTLIEVLVALFILATGILGAVAMQTTAKKGSFDAMQRSMASAMAQDIIERMRGNDSSTLALYAAQSPYGSGKISSPPTCNSGAVTCLPGQMVTHDLYGWEQSLIGTNVKNGTNNLGGLENAIGCITVNGNAVTVVVTWSGKAEFTDAKKSDACGTTSTTRRQILVDAFIL